MKQMTVWALFDSGNGSYTKGVQALNDSKETNIDIYPVGIDIEGKNEHFISLDLADYGRLFGDNKMFETLDQLPRPDLIIASPPCESWSNASAMDQGNACWKRNDVSDMDSGSTDQTCAIAERMGAQIVHRPDWRGFGPQRNHQIAACQAEYIFFLDADEEIGPDLRAEIQAVAASGDDAIWEVLWEQVLLLRRERRER